ncbi:MAG TPA: hypothetical protein VKT82_14360 [Ktedonobacterales bacterium]|nr:hypothetical protein [Ktedonobacterales bacterium]
MPEPPAVTSHEAADDPPAPDAPPADFARFVEMVARETHTHLDADGIHRLPQEPQQRALDEYAATRTPDAADPSTLQPSGLRPARLVHAPKGDQWPIAGSCTGRFCEGECVCGEHLCDECGCEAGALIDHHPWYYERRVARRGAICEYCCAPATVASRWKTPMCERCWLIASRGAGINPRAYQPRPFGPMETDDEDDEEMAGD